MTTAESNARFGAFVLLLVLLVSCSSSDFAGSSAGIGSRGSNNATGNEAGDSDGNDEAGDAGDGEEGEEERGGAGGDAGGESEGGLDGDGDADGGDLGSDGGGSGNDGIQTDEDKAADQCDRPSGSARASITVGGEDVPGNGLVGGPDKGSPLGSDFHDYTLTIEGDLMLDRPSPTAGRIGIAKSGEIRVSYKRETTACSHDFTFVVRKCANKDSTELARHKLSIGTGNAGATKFKVSTGKVYLDIVMTVRGSARTDYGGCPLPGAVTNKLYGNAMPGFML